MAHHRIQKERPYISALEIMYYDRNMSLARIGAVFHTSKTTVKRWFDHYDLEIREEKIRHTIAKTVRKTTLITLYDVDHASKIIGFKKKINETYNRSPGILLKANKKRVQTMLTRYGREYAMQVKEFIIKGDATKRQRYTFLPGYNRSIESIEKYKATIHHKYGIKNISSIGSPFREKVFINQKKYFETNLKKYPIKNLLRDETFWYEMKTGKTISQLASIFNVNVGGLTKGLNRQENKKRFKEYYKFTPSKIQAHLYDLLLTISPELHKNTRRIIKPLELDIYSPISQIAIEYNGSYWHSSANKMNAYDDVVYRHKIKSDLCLEKNINLIHVYEHYYEKDPNRYDQFLLSFFSKSTINEKVKIENIKDDSFIAKYKIPGDLLCGKLYKTIKDTDNNIITTVFYSLIDGCAVIKTIITDFKYCIGTGIKYIVADLLKDSNNVIIEIVGYSLMNKLLDNYNYIITRLEPEYMFWLKREHTYMSKEKIEKEFSQQSDVVDFEDWCKINKIYKLYDSGKIQINIKNN